jgi:hypothetical protein
MQRDPLSRYLAGRAITAPWRLEGEAGQGFHGCVVIPALAESQRLFHTLDSLAANPADQLSRFLIVVVVNHREDATPEEKQDNALTLARLRCLESPLRLAFIDAATPGLELGAKSGGVGMARRIGLDLALPRLQNNGVMVCLDADTLVRPDYLPAISDHFAGSRAGGAVIPFSHQKGATAAEERAILLYELYLRHYVLGLQWAGSLYGFHCVGSAMACSSAAYLKMGGMNSRRAGEDFYFLQQLQRVSGIAQLTGTTVHPSARSSHRVPFGTGKSISRILSMGEESQTFYRVECFSILKEWLALVEQGAHLSGRQLLEQSAAIDPQLASFLAAESLEQVWDRLRRNSGEREALLNAFHGWFDALKTVRLVHQLSLLYPRCPAAESLPALLRAGGHHPVEGEAEQLNLLRVIENVNT